MNPEQKKREEFLTQLFHEAPISKIYGMKLSYDEEGSAIFTLPYNPNFNHGLGGIHGGVIATMIDNAGWFTVATHFDTWIATVEFKTHLFEPVKECELKAQGKLIRLGKSLSTTEMFVRNSKDKLIAMGTGTFVVTSVPFTK